MLAQAVQRGCAYPIRGDVPGHVGWGPDIMVGSPFLKQGVGTWSSLRSLPTQTLLWFYMNSEISKALKNATELYYYLEKNIHGTPLYNWFSIFHLWLNILSSLFFPFAFENRFFPIWLINIDLEQPWQRLHPMLHFKKLLLWFKYMAFSSNS